MSEISEENKKKLTDIISYTIKKIKDKSAPSLLPPQIVNEQDINNKKQLINIVSYAINEIKKKSKTIDGEEKENSINGEKKENNKNGEEKENSINGEEKENNKNGEKEETINNKKDAPNVQDDNLRDNQLEILWKLQNNILLNEKDQNMDIELAIHNKKSKYNTIRKIDRLFAALNKKASKNITHKAKVMGKIVFNNKKKEPEITQSSNK